MLPILREAPREIFRPGALEEGIPAHRWEKYVIPKGASIEDLPRNSEGRLLNEVPGDGNVFDHQLAQERLVRHYGILDVWSETAVMAGYVKIRPLTQTEHYRLCVTALIHDVGEIEHGDVVYDDKHAALHTRADEAAATKRFVRRAVDERLSRTRNENEEISKAGREDLRRKRRITRELLSAYGIDHDSGHRLHGLFKLYEKYSYLNGAISIYDHGNGSIAQSHYGVHNVLKNQIGPLVAAARAGIPSALAFLEERAETVTAMFAWVCYSGFRDENDGNQKAFEEAKRTWSKYLETVPLGKGRRNSGTLLLEAVESNRKDRPLK